MKENILNPEKLKQLSKNIYDIACAHGWHEKPLSQSHWLCLVMTEVAEAVEADRNNRHAETDLMADVMKVQAEGEYGLSEQWYETWFGIYYREYIKGSIDEEFADIVIRLLDTANEIHGKDMKWWDSDIHIPYYCRTFSERAWHFVKDVLNCGTFNISDSIAYMYQWAKQEDIDLDKHIEWKMKYNELRPYKHGGKKY